LEIPEQDEFIAFAGHLIAALFFWIRWFSLLWSRPPLGMTTSMRWPMWCAPFVAISVVMSLLGSFAASDVRETIYMGFYAVIGLAWVGAGVLAFSTLGPSLRDDVIERRNNPAAVTLLGAVFGFSFAFAGGNFGDGPGWWVVVFCSVLSLGTLMLLWLILDLLAHTKDAITIDRDAPTAVRTAFLLMACGGILGRSVAGDWFGFSHAFFDFMSLFWPALLLVLADALITRGLAPVKPGAPPVPGAMFLRGLLPGVVYLIIAAGYIVILGWW